LGNTLETCHDNYEDLTDIEDFTGNENDPEDEYEELPLTDDHQLRHLSKRKHVRLCRHKLQGRAHCQSRRLRQTTDLQPRISELGQEDTARQWAQLKQMEEIIAKHKKECLKHGIHESDDEESEDKDWGEHQGRSIKNQSLS
jgi:hypothetical protein